MKTYEEGFKNAHNFVTIKEIDFPIMIDFIDYLKGLAIEHNKPHFAGIADGIWEIILRNEVNQWIKKESIELKFADEPGKYDSRGNCYFRLINGERLKLSAKDCLEVFNTLADIAIMPFDRDRIAEQIEEKLIEEDLM